MELVKLARRSRPVLAFAASGLVTLVLLGLVGVELLRRTGTSEAIADAKRVTRLAAEGIVQPEVTDALTRGDPGAVARVDRAVRARLLRDPVVRVKIWTLQGRIVYSDERRLIGARYAFAADDLAVVRRGGVEAEVSDLSRPENRFERPYSKLLEVYLPIRTPQGRPLLFESYLRFSSVAASGRHLLLSFAPWLVGALVLLWLVQLPLAWRMARRLREGQVEREALLQRALDASELERRRIARDLHDGVVQSLAGVSYALAAEAEDAPAAYAEPMREAAGETRNAIRELRTLLVEIYPPDLHRVGLAGALPDLVAPLARGRIATELDVPRDLQLASEVEALFFRVAQEALRNVLAHSGASRVVVRVGQDSGGAWLEVEDDGTAFDPSTERDGHFGLRIVEEAARETGGTAQIESEPGRGTRVRVDVPAARLPAAALK